MNKQLFSVDVKGMRELYAGKPKWFVIRELIQNAWDENITTCMLDMKFARGEAIITVIDDSPTGFKDLSDAYTLFRTTHKRTNVRQRGRFNLGEKQVICLCEYAKIITTTGGVEFYIRQGERKHLRLKREKGSAIEVHFRMTREEYEECIKYLDSILVPEKIYFKTTITDRMEHVDDGRTREYTYTAPFKKFSASLKTELMQGDSMRIIRSNTDVHIHKPINGSTAMIYEMGIPVCEIDCDFSIDVQQKIPLSPDRDRVDPKYLKELYALVLNNCVEEISEENAADTWVRSGIETGMCSKEVTDAVVESRFGEKNVIANPFDPRSIDEAISQGYTVVTGSQMSGDEWKAIKANNSMESSSAKFGIEFTSATPDKPTKEMQKVFEFARRVAVKCLNKNIVCHVFNQGTRFMAVFEVGGSTLTFYKAAIPNEWWLPNDEGFVRTGMLELIIHELAHHYGHHTEHAYLHACTRIGAELVKEALNNKKFFKL